MRGILMKAIILLAAGVISQTPAFAVPIQSTITPHGGNLYAFAYTIGNNTAFELHELSIYFDHAFYSNLQLLGTPANWDPILIQPDQTLDSDGFVDILASGAGLSPGDVLTGLSVLASYGGPGMPDSQYFEFVDPQTFDVLFSGQTDVQIGPAPGAVDAPGTLLLVCLGLAALRRSRPGANGMSARPSH